MSKFSSRWFYIFYILPLLIIDISSQNPIKPANRKPAKPMIGISCHLSGIPERTIRPEPMTRDARTIAKERRLLIRSWLARIGSSSRGSNSIFNVEKFSQHPQMCQFYFLRSIFLSIFSCNLNRYLLGRRLGILTSHSIALHSFLPPALSTATTDTFT